MILRVPSYYKEFRCIAEKCQDSCCIGWEIDIDEDTFDYYKSIKGDFGKKLKQYMVSDEVNSFVLRENGWCPFLNERKLCEICIELGEEALSEVCTEYPRFTVTYGDVMEKALSLSCEEVGRIVFSNPEKMMFEEMELPGMYEMEDSMTEDEEDGEIETFQIRLEETRDHAIALLQDRSQPIRERIRSYLLYCAKEQGICMQTEDRKEKEEMETSAKGYFKQRLHLFRELEVLNDEWTDTLNELEKFFETHDYLECQKEYESAAADREYEYEHLMVYFTFRYFMKAWYDNNLFAKAQLAAVNFCMIRDMDVVKFFSQGKQYDLLDRIENVKKYSREVEHSEENLQLLEEEFSFEEEFHLEELLRQI